MMMVEEKFKELQFNIRTYTKFGVLKPDTKNKAFYLNFILICIFETF